jgi:hypothetical protein
MKSQSLQEMVRTINQDETTRARFQADPEGVISQFALSDEEKRAVLSAYAKIGLGFTGASKLDSEIGPMSFWL